MAKAAGNLSPPQPFQRTDLSSPVTECTAGSLINGQVRKQDKAGCSLSGKREERPNYSREKHNAPVPATSQHIPGLSPSTLAVLNLSAAVSRCNKVIFKFA